MYPQSQTRINAIEEHVAPFLKSYFADLGLDVIVNLEFHHDNKYVHMYIARVVFTHKIDCDQMCTIADIMKTFCMWEGQSFKVDNRKYEIGDGDDTGAAMFDNGTLQIWVRHFL